MDISIIRVDTHSPEPIYEQIAYSLVRMIAMKEFGPDDRLPSVREIAVLLKVNPNTVVRTFNKLTDLGLITVRRGIGNFISVEAISKAKKIMNARFIEALSREVRKMRDAGFSEQEIDKIIKLSRRKK